jgi:hypothetical protein
MSTLCNYFLLSIEHDGKIASLFQHNNLFLSSVYYSAEQEPLTAKRCIVQLDKPKSTKAVFNFMTRTRGINVLKCEPLAEDDLERAIAQDNMQLFMCPKNVQGNTDTHPAPEPCQTTPRSHCKGTAKPAQHNCKALLLEQMRNKIAQQERIIGQKQENLQHVLEAVTKKNFLSTQALAMCIAADCFLSKHCTFLSANCAQALPMIQRDIDTKQLTAHSFKDTMQTLYNAKNQHKGSEFIKRPASV